MKLYLIYKIKMSFNRYMVECEFGRSKRAMEMVMF